ncbi:MAG TPA: hypothetical protein VEA99_19635, partial [Gemmatimonadaceae bacterium]|nr:hypothetical protein [Gemmatimonadaceae bacterium]
MSTGQLSRLAQLSLAAVLVACGEDRPLATAPVATQVASGTMAAQGGGGGRSALDLIEDDYAVGVLDKENANRYRAYAVHAPDKLPA